MAGSLTAANAVIAISIQGLYPVPQNLVQFATDEVFDGPSLASAEVEMGVDGVLSGGFVYVKFPQKYTFRANSPSIAIFDNWWQAQQALTTILAANASIKLPALGKKWTLLNGFLTSYQPIPNAKKLLQPQVFEVSWQNVIAAPG